MEITKLQMHGGYCDNTEHLSIVAPSIFNGRIQHSANYFFKDINHKVKTRIVSINSLSTTYLSWWLIFHFPFLHVLFVSVLIPNPLSNENKRTNKNNR